MMFLHELDLSRKLKPGKKPIRQVDIEGLNIDKEMLNFNSSKDILLSPSLLIDIFRASVRKRIPLSAEVIELLDKIVLQTKNRSVAVSALNLQVKTGRISEFEALSRIDEWKEHHEYW